jgi:hypothetical protein
VFAAERVLSAANQRSLLKLCCIQQTNVHCQKCVVRCLQRISVYCRSYVVCRELVFAIESVLSAAN